MKITIECPHCNSILEDKFSVSKCSVQDNAHTYLEMECLTCEKMFDVELDIKIKEKENKR
jgi:transcription elongation factor Elf1